MSCLVTHGWLWAGLFLCGMVYGAFLAVGVTIRLAQRGGA